VVERDNHELLQFELSLDIVTAVSYLDSVEALLRKDELFSNGRYDRDQKYV
jgi:hypothetical protein